jgi:hypothetical protein
MSRSFGLVEYKVLEAEYFLKQLHEEGKKLNFSAVQYCASAFVSATRSITFAMQASLKSVEAFEDWYAFKQKMLKEDSLASFFHNFRTYTQHIGGNAVVGGSRVQGNNIFFFGACPDLPVVPSDDVETACKDYFKTVLKIVFDCYIEFGTLIDGQQRYTENFFNSLDKTIEDAEEEQGLPRGWTDIGDPNSMPYRWQLLRRNADGCEIEGLFFEWLNLELPRVKLLPEYDK